MPDTERVRELPRGELVVCGRCRRRTYAGVDTPTPDAWHPNKVPRSDRRHRRMVLCGGCLGFAMTGLAHERLGIEVAR